MAEKRLSDAEWTVMNAVWDGYPASAREVLERTGAETSWAYSTVKTLLDRLVEKGALRAKRGGVAALYEPRLSRGEARRSALHALVNKAFDGAFGSLLQHLVAEEDLSPKERAALARAIADEARRKGAGG